MIYLQIKSDIDDQEIVGEGYSTYEELVQAIKKYKYVIKSIESGGSGISVCPSCGVEYFYGEDARADGGVPCEKCMGEI